MLDDKQPAAEPAATAAATPAPAPAPAAAKSEAPAAPTAADAKPGHNSKAVSDDIFDDLEEDDDGDGATPASAAAPTGSDDTEGESEDGNAAKPAKSDAPAWPEDWRQKLAGSDEKLLKRLNRFQSPESFFKSYKALEQKLSSGEYKRALGEDASPEEIAAWRKENGVPEKPTEYTVPEITGHQWTDADKPVIASFAEVAHEANLPKGAFEKVTAWYAGVVQAQKEQMAEIDRNDRLSTEDELRTKWQGEYRPTMTLVKRLLGDTDVLPEGLGTRLAGARTADGRRLINQPEMLSFLADLARDRYGEGALIPGEQAKAMGERKAEIEKIMRSDINRYYTEKNSEGKTLEAEYREILSREQGGGRRGRAA